MFYRGGVSRCSIGVESVSVPVVVEMNDALQDLRSIPAEDAEQPGHVQVLPAFDGQLLDASPPLLKGTEFVADAFGLLALEVLFLQTARQLLQRNHLQRKKKTILTIA